MRVLSTGGFIRRIALCGALILLSPAITAAEICYPPAQPASDRQPDDSQEIVLDADVVESRENEWIRLQGTVDMLQGDRRIRADNLQYSQMTGGGNAEGNVHISQPDLQISGSVAVFDMQGERAQINNADYLMLGRPGHGIAKQIRVEGRDRIEMHGARYTTCAPNKEVWWLSARRIVLDKANNNGEAYGTTIRFKQVPIIYLPYINFALGERKSGLLAPSYGNSDRRGFTFQIPIYWNAATNHDVTLTPYYMSKRGWMLQSEYRYLLPSGTGKLHIDYLSRDNETGEARGMSSLTHQGRLGKSWWAELDYKEVTDQYYVRDMGGLVIPSSTSIIDRHLMLSRYGRNFGIDLVWQGFQPLAYSVGRTTPLYYREPQIILRGEKALSGRVTTELATELVNFTGSNGLAATRLDMAPALSYRADAGWGFVEPKMAWRYTQYWLSGSNSPADQSPTRSLPIISLDTGVVTERSYSAGRWLHTIEPRLYYLYVPYRDQTGLIRDRSGNDVLFDTARAELNYEQQFNTNRYVGADRQGDANQFNWGVQSRLINGHSGQEVLTAALGQTVYLVETQVTLPGQSPVAAGRSDLFGSLAANYKAWRLDGTGQWREAENKPTAAHLRMTYREQERSLRASVSYREGLVKQGELIGRWPVSTNWKLMGHVIHSFLQSRTLQAAVGAEYSDCCWAARLAARRFVNGLTGQTSQTIGFELELKGLANFGSNMASFSSFN